MIALCAAVLCFGIYPAWGTELYVDASAAGGDGASWATAYTDLHDALRVAAAGDSIHVARGTYIPGGTRDASFVLNQNLTLLGGYPAGGGERDPANPTVLSGEIGAYGRSDNIHHVVIISGGSDVTLDGFTITGGNADGGFSTLGGGMLVSGGGQVALENVKFSYNEAEGGGGLQFSGESLTLSNVRFFGNVAISRGGGGLHFSHGALVMNRVEFDRNRARGGGGGLYFTGTSSLDLDDVIFIGNRAIGSDDSSFASTGRGGGICIDNVKALESSALGTMANVTLHNNWAYGIDYGWGGGIFVGLNTSKDYYAYWRWDVFLTNVTLSGNNAYGGIGGLGGGICINYSSAPRNIYMSNVTLHGNLAKGEDDDGTGKGGGIYIGNWADVSMSHVTVADNTASGYYAAGGGVYEAETSIIPGYVETNFWNSIFWGNAPDQLQGSYSPDFCIVEGGYSPGFGNITEDPMLGTIGFYGGLTPTLPLLEGSSAIDAAIDLSSDPDFGPWWTPDTDQRGELRPQGSGRDIGAYEASVGIENILIDPSDPVPVSTEIHAEAGFTGSLSGTNAYTATWNWGDGNSSDGAVDKSNGIVTGTHSYAAPGVYTVALEISEQSADGSLAGLLKKAVYQYVVVYDPAAGFVSGGGWFDSPAGAYVDDPALSGVASFGFVSRYKKDAAVPTGNTAFEFAAGGLYFHSTSYDWLVVTGSDYAKFKGSGTINGWGDYKFMLWAGDGEPDTFRIRIWEENEETGEETDIYDNGFDQAIGGGSIVIHAK